MLIAAHRLGQVVAINTMILSLVYRLRRTSRLIMVDPKMLESPSMTASRIC